MKSVQAIINLFGGLASFSHVRVECEGYMALVIEAIGPGPRGLPQVSVAHYYTQQGDAMRDPEMTFEVSPDSAFSPVSYTQDNMGLYQEAVSVDNAGQVMVRPRLVKDLTAFARQWDRNLKEQGFVDAARAEVRRRAAAR